MASTITSFLKHVALGICLPFVIFQLKSLLRKRPKQTVIYINGKRRRELGGMEGLYHDYLKRIGGAVSFVVVIESSCTLSDKSLIEALSAVSNRHPQLRMGIVEEHKDDTTRYYFEELTDFNLDYQHVDLDSISIQDCEEAFRSELLKAVNVDTGPLWRVARLQEGIDKDTDMKVNCLVFTFHHAIIDGVSMIKFLEELLDNLDAVFSEPREELALLPSAETLLEDILYVPWWKRGLINAGVRLANLGIFSLKMNRSKPYYDKYPIVMKKDSSIQSDTRGIFIALSKSETERIVTECRKQKCTVTGAITAATSIAMAQILQDGSVSNDISIPSGCLVNLRVHCNRQDVMDALGVFSSRLSVECNVPAFEQNNLSEVFWNLARQCTQDIHDGVKKNKHLDAVKTVNALASNTLAWSLLSQLADKNNGGRFGTDYFCNSNIGRFDISKGKKEKFEISKLFFGVAEHVTGIVFINNTVTIGGHLCWTLVHYSNITRLSQAEDFKNKIFSNLSIAVGNTCS